MDEGYIRTLWTTFATFLKVRNRSQKVKTEAKFCGYRELSTDVRKV